MLVVKFDSSRKERPVLPLLHTLEVYQNELASELIMTCKGCVTPSPAKMTVYPSSWGPFHKQVKQTLSLNLNSELIYSEIGNSEFSVPEQQI